MLNLNFYKEDIIYDKFIDEKIEEKFSNNYFKCKSEEDYVETLVKGEDIESLFTISSIRGNILEWYPFKKSGTVLEIGGRLGELTGILCEKAKEVTTLEFSKRRGEIIAARHKTKKNLEIIIGNLEDIQLNKKFDYITLIGIFDYAPYIFNNENSYVELLKYLKRYLKRNGKILIAIDNRFGIQYFAGVKNEHYDNIYDTITLNSKNVNSKIFSKRELEDIFLKAKVKYSKFYYPLPNYKITNVIYSDKYLPKEQHTKSLYSNLYNESAKIKFNEANALKQLTKNQMFEQLSNSFFIELSNQYITNNVKFVSYNYMRKRKYRLMLKIIGNKVEKQAVSGESIQHINQIKENISMLKKLGFDIIDRFEKNKITATYVSYKELYSIVLDFFKKMEFENAYCALEEWYKYISIRLLNEENNSNNIFEKYNIEVEETLLGSMHITKYGYIDLALENTFYNKGKYKFYDQEWYFENIPVEYILYRAINNLYLYNFDELSNIISFDSILDRFGILEYKEVFERLEKVIQEEINSEVMVKLYRESYKNI